MLQCADVTAPRLSEKSFALVITAGVAAGAVNLLEDDQLIPELFMRKSEKNPALRSQVASGILLVDLFNVVHGFYLRCNNLELRKEPVLTTVKNQYKKQRKEPPRVISFP